MASYRNKRDILILDCDDIKCPQVLRFVFDELCGCFRRYGHNVKVITTLNDLHDDSIVFMGNIFGCEKPADLLHVRAPNAIYIGWYWHNIDVSILKYFIHTYENVLNLYFDSSRINDYVKLTTSKVNVPLLLRANEDPELVGKYERNIKYDYCYMGWGYCTHLIPGIRFDGFYHGVYDHNKFLSYDARRDVYLSSIFALGFQAAENIGYKHVSQRIFEGLAYGCIVLSNSLPASEQTNGIVIFVSSLEDLESKMDYYKNNPSALAQKQKDGYEFTKKFGTNHYAVQKIAESTQNGYNINILE